MEITVRDVMSSQIAVRRGATFKDMAAALREHRISGRDPARPGVVAVRDEA